MLIQERRQDLAAEYELEGEDVELSKKTLGSYVKKASVDKSPL